MVRLTEPDLTYAMLTEPGIRRFVAESDRFYPADAVEPLLVHAFLRARHMSPAAAASFAAIAEAALSLARSGRLPATAAPAAHERA